MKLHEVKISLTLLNYPKIKRFAAIKDTFGTYFSVEPKYEIFQICYCCLFLFAERFAQQGYYNNVLLTIY